MVENRRVEGGIIVHELRMHSADDFHKEIGKIGGQAEGAEENSDNVGPLFLAGNIPENHAREIAELELANEFVGVLEGAIILKSVIA